MLKKRFSKFNFWKLIFFTVPEFKFLKSIFLCILKLKFRNTIWKTRNKFLEDKKVKKSTATLKSMICAGMTRGKEAATFNNLKIVPTYCFSALLPISRYSICEWHDLFEFLWIYMMSMISGKTLLHLLF